MENSANDSVKNLQDQDNALRARICIKKYADFRQKVEKLKNATLFEKADLAEAALTSAVDVMGDLVFFITDMGLQNGQK